MTNLITRLQWFVGEATLVNEGKLDFDKTVAKNAQSIAADLMERVPEKRILGHEHISTGSGYSDGFNEAIDQVVRGLTDYFASSLEPEHSPETSPPNTDPTTIIHKECGTVATKGAYSDGVVDYLCPKCDVTFLNDEEQSVIS